MVDTSTIREHMEVFASCGSRIGTIDRVEGTTIKLAKNDPMAAGVHHFIPLDWVAQVDHQVHLRKNTDEVAREWKAEPAAATARV